MAARPVRALQQMKRTVPFIFSVVFAASGLLQAQDSTPQESDGTQPAPASTQLTLNDLRTFTDVFNQVRQNYVEPVSDRNLLEAAINGMLSDLDPHSAYLPTSDYEELENSARGEYVGLGIDVATGSGRMMVKSVISPSPADTAGINPGDIILAIDDKPVKGRLLQQSIDALSGPPGSTVKLKVSAKDDTPRTLVLTRDYVKVPALNFRLLDDHYGYFQIVYFHRDSAVDLKRALESTQADGITLYGLIIDLRDNPGGVLQPAIEIADGFLDQGEIVSIRGRNATMQMEFSAERGQWLEAIPMAVLVDRGSASASEVLAGALQDNGRAVIVGERTFGKGSVQTVLPLRNGAGIKLTTARYYTPSGKSIQAQGIDPDVRVANAVSVIELTDDRKLEADLDRHLNNETADELTAENVTIDAEEDYPLFEALNLLRAAHVFNSSNDVNLK